jgi:LmbE family N-acetylglucosaminyl deacetylase
MRILAVSAHPDDETLGCGGTLLSHLQAGDELHWVVITKGTPDLWSEEVLAKGEQQVDNVAAAYKMRSYVRVGLPATKLDTIGTNEIIRPIREAIQTIRPEIVYTVHGGDINTDHFMTFQAVTIVLKPFHMRDLGVRRLLSFECLSSTDAAPSLPGRVFCPNVFCDISDHVERKIEIMNLYRTEMQSETKPRSDSAIRALARFRGATISVPYAEAFMLIREVQG